MLLDPVISSDLRIIIEALGKDPFSSRKVLVTGGAGFIGSWLCDTLIITGAAIRCVDDLSTGVMGSIEHLMGKKAFHFVKLEVAKPKLWRTKFDHILHFASRA